MLYPLVAITNIKEGILWANNFVTPIDLMREGFNEDNEYKLLQAFQKVTLKDRNYFAENINPAAIKILEPIHESKFGDDWNSLLDKIKLTNVRTIFKK